MSVPLCMGAFGHLAARLGPWGGHGPETEKKTLPPGAHQKYPQAPDAHLNRVSSSVSSIRAGSRRFEGPAMPHPKPRKKYWTRWPKRIGTQGPRADAYGRGTRFWPHIPGGSGIPSVWGARDATS